MKSLKLPGAGWVGWLKSLPCRIGVLTGVYLIAIMSVALIAANRLPFLEVLADIRNLACYAAFGLVMLLPVIIFLRKPWCLFTSGFIAWVMFSVAFAGAGQTFTNLFTRLRPPFNVFMIGAVFYGVVAVAFWFVQLVVAMRSHLSAQHHHRGRAYPKA
jgi:hypothetical protein